MTSVSYALNLTSFAPYDLISKKEKEQKQTFVEINTKTTTDPAEIYYF